jgi:hypothetical protein
VSVTRELGVNLDEFLELYGLSTVQFYDPDFEIPYATAGRLLARSAKAQDFSHPSLTVVVHMVAVY